MNILAGKHFNAGLRAIFFSIGYLGWFVGPPAFALSTLVLFAVLIRRQFFSAARAGPSCPTVPADQFCGPGKTESMRPVNL